MGERRELLCNSEITIVPHLTDNKTLSQKVALEKNQKDDQDPFFVVNLTALIERFMEFKRELPNIKPFYSVKSSADPVIITVLAKLGCSFDCASEGEISKVMKLNVVPPENIIFANPCKSKKGIRLASKVGVNIMTFDSIEDLPKVKQFHKNPEMVLRIAVHDPLASSHLKAKFGCDPEKVAPKLLQEAKDLGITVVGIAFHIGSSCKRAEVLEAAIRHSKNLIDMGKKLGHPVKLLDIGGGLPGLDDEEMNFKKIAGVLRDLIDKYLSDNKELTIIAEPGRFFTRTPVSKAVNIISSVKVPASRITKKEQDSEKHGFMYFINQGVFGTFCCRIYDKYFPTGEPLFPDSEGDIETFHSLIWGPTCHGMDQVEEYIKIRHLHEDEWLYYPNMGAYTVVASSTFNGFEIPKPFYFIDEISWKLIREKVEE